MPIRQRAESREQREGMDIMNGLKLTEKKGGTMKNWKKAMLALVAALVVLSVGQVAQALDSTDTITITVTTSHIGISLTTATAALGFLAVGATTVYDLGWATNTGNVTETIAMRASGSASWALGNNPTADQFTLAAIFTTRNSAVAADIDTSDSTGNDILATTNKAATQDDVFSGNYTEAAPWDDAFQVNPATTTTGNPGTIQQGGGLRRLFIKLQTPTSDSSSGAQQTLFLTAVVWSTP